MFDLVVNTAVLGVDGACGVIRTAVESLPFARQAGAPIRQPASSTD
jgi:hypothetical protein